MELSNKQIAEKLFISIKTVDSHRQNLLHKLNVKNTAGLVKAAYKMELLGDCSNLDLKGYKLKK